MLTFISMMQDHTVMDLFNRILLSLLYLLTITVVVFVAIDAWDYWATPGIERPYHPRHSDYKPSGRIAHGLGIAGSSLMVALLTYSARKRLRIFHGRGNIRWWLNYHIWMGITGPLLVVLHTSFKIGGIVAVSFWSMVGVALSGILGRYLYLQIPRTRTGVEFPLKDLQNEEIRMTADLMDRFNLSGDSLAAVQDFEAGRARSGLPGLFGMLLDSITRPYRLHLLRRRLQSGGNLDRSTFQQVLRLVRRRVLLSRRIRFLDTAHQLLHHWHVIHRPFAVVMLVIMVIHKIVALLFGYVWLLGPEGS